MATAQSNSPVALVDEEINSAFDMRPKLQNGELITGTPTIEELVTTDLTITGQARNSAGTVEILKEDVPVDSAALCHIVGWVAGKVYRIKVTVVTDASDPATRIDIFDIPSQSSS